MRGTETSLLLHSIAIRNSRPRCSIHGSPDYGIHPFPFPMLCPIKGWLIPVSDKTPMSSLLTSLLRIDHQIITLKRYNPHLAKSGLSVFYQILIGRL